MPLRTIGLNSPSGIAVTNTGVVVQFPGMTPSGITLTNLGSSTIMVGVNSNITGVTTDARTGQPLLVFTDVALDSIAAAVAVSDGIPLLPGNTITLRASQVVQGTGLIRSVWAITSGTDTSSVGGGTSEFII